MALLIEIHTQANVIRYNTSDWDLTWGGFQWFAGDRLISLDSADEDMSGAVNSCVVTIAALDPATTSMAMSETLEGNRGVIYQVIFDPQTFQIVEAQKEFSGRVSNLILTKLPYTNG